MGKDVSAEDLFACLKCGENEYREGMHSHPCACPVQTKTIARELGIGFLGLGFDPKWRVEDVPVMPKHRYR